MFGKAEAWLVGKVYEFPQWFRMLGLVAIGYGLHCVKHYL